MVITIYNRRNDGRQAEKSGNVTLGVERERDLIRRTSMADESAFEELYQVYYERLYRFVLRVTGRSELIEEIINDVMYVVWEKASTYDHNCKPSTWIFGIAFNKARKSLQVPRAVAAERSLNEEDESALDDNWFKQVEQENWLNIAFESLSVEHRAVVEFTYFHGMHYHEIAEIMNCPENTVKTRMFHARRNLAAVLKNAAEAH